MKTIVLTDAQHLALKGALDLAIDAADARGAGDVDLDVLAGLWNACAKARTSPPPLPADGARTAA